MTSAASSCRRRWSKRRSGEAWRGQRGRTGYRSKQYALALELRSSDEHGSLSLDVLWPPATPGFGERPGDDPNANGIVARLRYGAAAVLFAADIGALEEITISQQACPGGAYPCLLRADVLKVAHHGSRYSTTQLLLDRVRPKLAVISVGAENPHGHPHPDTLGILSRSGIAALTTAERGTISLRTDGETIIWSTER